MFQWYESTLNILQLFITNSVREPTCVVEDRVFEGTIVKEGVSWLDILKVAVLKQRILKLHRPDLNVCKPGWKERKKGRKAAAETHRELCL